MRGDAADQMAQHRSNHGVGIFDKNRPVLERGPVAGKALDVEMHIGMPRGRFCIPSVGFLKTGACENETAGRCLPRIVAQLVAGRSLDHQYQLEILEDARRQFVPGPVMNHRAVDILESQPIGCANWR